MIQRVLFRVMLIALIYSILGSSEDTIHSLPIVSSCDTYLELFADAAANLTSCIIKHSRPFTVCKSCLQQYMSCQENYGILMETTSSNAQESCAKMLVHEDYVQMVVKVHDFVKDSWESNYCSSCYDSLETGLFSNKTQEFLQRLKTFDACIFDNLGNHLPYIIPGKLTVNKSICSTCLPSYRGLSDFYSSLDPNFDGHFCMDLSDSMNFTWRVWHEDFQCTLHYRSLDVCVATSAFVAVLPVIFYFLAKLCSSDITKIFLREKRLQDASVSINITADQT